MCMIPQAWEGTSSEQLVLVDMKNEAGEFYEYKDRRQEIVIIGNRLKRDNIQELLDSCLLTDDEMALGPEMWKETMGHLDIVNLTLGDKEEEEDGEDQDEECRKACELAQRTAEEGPPCKKSKA